MEIETKQEQITADNAISIIDSILNPQEPNQVEKLIKMLKETESLNDSEYNQSEQGELVYLDIYNKNNYSDENFNYLLAALKSLKNCYSLTLDFTNCQFGKRISEVFQPISGMTNLKQLIAEFNQNNIDEDIALDIANCLKKNVNLEVLKLSLKHNQLKQQGLINLSNGISELKSLKQIDIKVYDNHIENGMSHLVKKLGTLQKLEDVTIFFSKNEISNDQAIEFGDALGTLKSVTSLFINSGWNLIESEGLEQIAKGITKIPNLKKIQLFLSSNKIRAKGLLFLLQQINQCEQLNNIDINLSGNLLNADEVEELKEQFLEVTREFNTNLKNLTQLQLLLRKNDLKSSLNQFFGLLRQNKHLHHLVLDYSFNNQNVIDRKKVSTLMKKIPRLTTVIVHLDPNN